MPTVRDHPHCTLFFPLRIAPPLSFLPRLRKEQRVHLPLQVFGSRHNQVKVLCFQLGHLPTLYGADFIASSHAFSCPFNTHCTAASPARLCPFVIFCSKNTKFEELEAPRPLLALAISTRAAREQCPPPREQTPVKKGNRAVPTVPPFTGGMT